jgi:hypothetical protein
MVVWAVRAKPVSRGIRGKYRANPKKAHKSLAGKPPEPSIDAGFREKRAMKINRANNSKKQGLRRK